MDNFSNKKIAYQGTLGSYSHQCLLQHFPQAQHNGHITFEGAIQAVQTGTVDYALLPVENSIAGRVADIHHLLAQAQLRILAEFYHPIRHCLLAYNEANMQTIQHVYSHPMALAQCRKFLHTHNLESVPYTDTGDAARFVSEQHSPHLAAIAARTNENIYDNVIILAEDIQDVANNVTRFFLLGKEALPIPEQNTQRTYITAIFFTVKNIPAALFKSLSGFAENNINVTKLESFMPMLENASAHFYIEIDGTPQEASVQHALEALQQYAQKIEILGTFEKKSVSYTTH